MEITAEHKIHQGISTKEKPEAEESPNQDSRTQYSFLIAAKEVGMTYSDLTGRYTIILSRSDQYIVICYYYDNNIIQSTPTKTRNAAKIRDATMSMLSTLTTSVHQPNLHILDNDSSSSMKQGLLKNKIKYHLVPLHLHI